MRQQVHLQPVSPHSGKIGEQIMAAGAEVLSIQLVVVFST
jgi:hypothetical protein